MASLAGTGRRVPAASLFVLLASVSGCQLVFGLDDYGPRPAGQGGAGGGTSASSGGAGPGGATASVSVSAGQSSASGAGGSGGAAPCAPLAPEKITAGAPGFCGVRRLAAFSDPVGRELAPGAYCQGQACFVYFERRQTGVPDALMCGYCADLGQQSRALHRHHDRPAALSAPFELADGRLLFVSDRSGVSKIWIADAVAGTVTRATAEPAAVVEGTPFVDAQNVLWFAWGGGDAAGVIATAPPSGATWGKAVEVAGRGHVVGARDEAPRLLPDGLTLVFASTRSGGFFPGVSTIWAATRPSASSASWAAFPFPELGGVSGVSGPSIAADGCSIAAAATSRGSSFRRDIVGSNRILP